MDTPMQVGLSCLLTNTAPFQPEFAMLTAAHQLPFASKPTVLLQHAGLLGIRFLHIVPQHPPTSTRNCAAAACRHPEALLTAFCTCRWVPHHLPARPWHLISGTLTTHRA